jgi:hypothetical protein
MDEFVYDDFTMNDDEIPDFEPYIGIMPKLNKKNKKHLLNVY